MSWTIFLKPLSPPSLGHLPSSYPLFNVGLFNQIVCLFVCFYISLFLSVMQKFVSKLCRDLWRVLPWWTKFIRLFSHLSISPDKLFWIVFCPFLCIVGFLVFLCFFRNIQLLHITLLLMFLVLLVGLPH